MQSLTLIWSTSEGGDRPSRRFFAALALSIGCHALVLMLARGWGVQSLPSRLLVVTVVERGREGDVAVGAGSAASALAAVAVVTGRTVTPPHGLRRRLAPSHREAASPPAPALGAATIDAAAPAESAAGSLLVGVTDDLAASGNSGAPGVGRGDGTLRSGGGNGSGSDGLRAFCRSCPTPDYPLRARRQGWQGTVDVELAIGGDGVVEAARVGRSSGYPALDEVALGVARQSRFAVSASGDRLRGQLRYRFVLDETAARR